MAARCYFSHFSQTPNLLSSQCTAVVHRVPTLCSWGSCLAYRAINSPNSQDSSHHLGWAHFYISPAHTTRLPTACPVALPLGSFLAMSQKPTENRALGRPHINHSPHRISHPQASVCGPVCWATGAKRWPKAGGLKTICRTSLDIPPAAPHVS